MSKVIKTDLNYQIVPRNLVFDNSLSDRARFVYIFMLSKPDNWDFFLKPMASELGYSVDTLRKYIDELITSGWLEKDGQQTDEDGKFGATVYILNGTKKTDTENFRHGKTPTQDNIYNIENIDNKEKEKSKKEEKDGLQMSMFGEEQVDNPQNKKQNDDDFVEEIYKMYPSKCPKENRSLGKCSKDKSRIKALLKRYTKDQIRMVVQHEIDEKYGKSFMKNFSTFLNNFPDPTELEMQEELIKTNINNIPQEKGQWQ